jgi:hypothetical protein
MREERDRGVDNHLCEYLDNLYINYSGAFDCYPKLAEITEIVEVRSNIAFLKNSLDIDFKIWRSTVLRSVRLIHSAIVRNSEEG